MKVKNNAVLGDLAYKKIKNMILTREIKPGEKIQEQQIEQDLGMSRTPVREAVRRLSNEGIVNLYPNRFAEVISFDDKSIRDLGMVRITMDCLAAQLAIRNGSNRDFDELQELSNQCEEAHNAKNLFEQIQFDSKFHMKLLEISENDVLISLQKNIMLKTQLLQTTLIEDTSSDVCDVRNHSHILTALYDRNLPAVLEAIKNHLCPFYHLEVEDIHSVLYKL